MTEIEWLDAAIQRRSERCMDARDLKEYRDMLLAEAKTDELVEREVATRSDWTLPEP